jgi:hypothetical protein
MEPRVTIASSRAKAHWSGTAWTVAPAASPVPGLLVAFEISLSR